MLKDDLDSLSASIEHSVSLIENGSAAAQTVIYNMLKEELTSFEIKNNRFVKTLNKSYRRRLLIIENKIREILGREIYTTPLTEYLNSFTSIESQNVAMQKKFADLEVDIKTLAPAKQFVFEQASYYLKDAGLADAYITPAKYVIMQQVTSGATIKDSQAILKRWNNGELTDGQGTSGRQTPNLQRYTTQLARDTSYQYNGTINNIIAQELKLNGIIYVGNIIKGTRPICRHLVDIKEVTLTGLQEFIDAYPEGLIPDTNKDNFIVYRGGYNCRHLAYPIRIG